MRTLVFVLAILSACSRTPDPEIRMQAMIVAQHEGKPVQDAIDKLIPYGKRALPGIEATLHGASPEGKKNLIEAMRRIGDAEAVPLLGHIASYDDDESCRAEAEWTLKQWGMQNDPRGQAARSALRAVDEIRGTEKAG